MGWKEFVVVDFLWAEILPETNPFLFVSNIIYFPLSNWSSRKMVNERQSNETIVHTCMTVIKLSEITKRFTHTYIYFFQFPFHKALAEGYSRRVLVPYLRCHVMGLNLKPFYCETIQLHLCACVCVCVIKEDKELWTHKCEKSKRICPQ